MTTTRESSNHSLDGRLIPSPLLLLLFSLIILILAACGGGSSDQPVVAASDEQTGGSTNEEWLSPSIQNGLFLIAGQVTNSGFADGRGANARFNTSGDHAPLETRRLSMDGAGNLYVFDAGTFRKITPAGDVTTIAGLPNHYGYVDGVGSSARFSQSSANFAVDGGGNIYTVERSNYALRKVSPDGTVTTLTEIRHHWTYLLGVGVDQNGNLYVLDSLKIIRIAPDGSAMTLFERTQRIGDERYPPPSISLGNMKVDPTGNVYFVEGESPRGYAQYDSLPANYIRKISPDGDVSLVEGVPRGLQRFLGINLHHVDRQGNIFFSETRNVYATESPAWEIASFERILKRISPDGTVSTIDAFSTSYDRFDTSLPPSRTPNGALIDTGWLPGMAADGAGNIYYAGEGYIGKIDISGDASIIAGILPPRGNTNGPSTQARFQKTYGIAKAPDGSLYVGSANGIRKIHKDGQVTSFIAERSIQSGHLASDSLGNIYAMDGYSLVKISPTGQRSLLAGSRNSSLSKDGIGPEAGLGVVRGMKAGADGNIYFFSDYTVRRVTPQGEVTTLAGSRSPSLEPIQDGVGNQARFRYGGDIEIDSVGNLYLLEALRTECSHAIRRITLGGEVTTPFRISQHGSDGSCERYSYLAKLAIDAADNLYVLNTYNSLIHKVAPNGTVTQIAGDLHEGFTSPNFNGSLQNAYDLELIAPRTLAITGGYGVIGLRSDLIGNPPSHK